MLYNWGVKAIRIFLLVLIITGLGLIFTQNLWVPSVVAFIIKNDSKSEISVVATTTPEKKEVISTIPKFTRVPADFDSGGYGSIELDRDRSAFVNPLIKDVVSFKIIDDELLQPRNPTQGVYINNNKIGEFVAEDISMPIFSPDNRYVIFKTMGSCGAACRYLYTYAVDLASSSISAIPTPRSEEEYKGEKSETEDVVPYIESYVWKDENILRVISYFVVDGDTRTSPKEIWDFNIATGKYTFVQTIPE